MDVIAKRAAFGLFVRWRVPAFWRLPPGIAKSDESPNARGSDFPQTRLHMPVIAKQNIVNARDVLAQEDTESFDGCLITFAPNIRWLTGFTGSNGLVLLTQDGVHLVTDGRYTGQARDETPEEVSVHISTNGLFASMSDEGLLEDVQSVLVQGDHVTVQEFERLKERFDDVHFEPRSQLLDAMVAEKSSAEVDAIRTAQSLTDEVFSRITDIVRPGRSEREVAADLVHAHLRGGASSMSFDPIVASGPNSALPHARPTSRVITSGDVVVIDMGGFVDGYASDMTRTIVVGEPSARVKDVYNAVLEAQQAALQAARGGIRSKDLDAAARSVLEDHGLADHFSHGLGHGLGLEIHEWPRVSKHSDDTLPVGAVITIEPGVYLEGDFGIRIEDIVVLQEEGCLNLTGSPKALMTIPAHTPASS